MQITIESSHKQEREMQIFEESWFGLWCMVIAWGISVHAVHAQPRSPERDAPAKVGDVPVIVILPCSIGGSAKVGVRITS
jgi:hypothetical protein